MIKLGIGKATKIVLKGRFLFDLLLLCSHLGCSKDNKQTNYLKRMKYNFTKTLSALSPTFILTMLHPGQPSLNWDKTHNLQHFRIVPFGQTRRTVIQARMNRATLKINLWLIIKMHECVQNRRSVWKM